MFYLFILDRNINEYYSISAEMEEISSKVGEDTKVCSHYIKSLIKFGIIQKETPYGEKSLLRCFKKGD